jgi:hypothetical protein
METTKIDRSIFAILSTISIDNLTSEQATFILHSAYVKGVLKFNIKNTIIDIIPETYRQELDNLLEIHNSTAYLKLITADSTFEPAIKMSAKRFLTYADKIINDDMDVIITFI